MRYSSFKFRILCLLHALIFCAWLRAESFPGQPKELDVDEYIDWVGHSTPPRRQGKGGYAGESFENFGSGITTTTGTPGDDVLRAVVMQTDGTIISAGRTVYSQSDSWVTKQNPDGSLDTSFATTGKTVLALGADDDIVHAIAVATNGKIILAGRRSKGPDLDFMIARLRADGSLDSTFATVGYASASFDTGTDIARSVWIDSTGKYTVAGYAGYGNIFHFAMARFLTDGTLDTSFNTTGKKVVSFGSNTSSAVAMAAPRTMFKDDVVVIGGVFQNGDFDLATIRIKPDGTLDTAYNTTGMAVFSFGTGVDFGYAITRHGDDPDANNYFLTGSTTNNGALDAFTARIRSNGTLDTIFCTRGFLVTSLGTGDDTGLAISVTTTPSSKRVLVAGASAIAAGTSGYNLGLFRISVYAGGLDTGFNTTGKLTLSIGTSEDSANGVTNLSSNVNIVTGRTWNGTNYDGFILRLDDFGSLAPSGAVDRTFGTNGMVTTSTTSSAVINGTRELFIDTGGQIWLAGDHGDIYARTLDSAGTLPGFVTSLANSSLAQRVERFIQMPGTGAILVSMRNLTPSYPGYLYRLRTDGVVDTSFSTDGLIYSTQQRAVALGTDGDIYWLGSNPATSIYFQRIASNGSIVNTSTVGCPSGYGCMAEKAVQTPSGGIAYVGYQNRNEVMVEVSSSGYQLLVGRYRSNGTIDTSFGTTGMISLENGNLATRGRDITANEDGTLTIFYDLILDSTANAAAVLRLNSNGTLDTRFGNGQPTTYYQGITTNVRRGATLKGGKSVMSAMNYQKMSLIRLTTDGQIDTCFNSGAGSLTGNISITVDTVNYAPLAVDKQGMIYTGIGTGGRQYLFRYFP